jgi:hypothetical protein
VNTASTEAQNARASAEQAVAAAGTAAANAQLAAAQAIAAPVPPAPPPTDAQLLLTFVRDILAGGKVGGGVLPEAQAQLAAYKRATRPPTPAPQ